MRVNYIGGVYCTKSVVETMKNRKFGRIVFVSSQAGQIGIYGYTAYSATKFALRGLAEALQMELKPYNIYVTVSYPPDTDTPGFKEELKDKVSIECEKKKQREKIQLFVSNVVQIIEFLLSVKRRVLSRRALVCTSQKMSRSI